MENARKEIIDIFQIAFEILIDEKFFRTKKLNFSLNKSVTDIG